MIRVSLSFNAWPPNWAAKFTFFESLRRSSAYLTYLKEEADYTDANFRRFVDVAFVVHESDSTEEMNGEIVQITLSQSSIPSFSRYQEKLQMKARAVARKVPGVAIPADPFTFYFLRQEASAKGNDWTKLELLDKLPAKI